MAKVDSSFQCRICKQELVYPPNTDVTRFTILFLQFYVDHDRCEKLANFFAKDQEVKIEKIKAELLAKQEEPAKETEVPDADRSAQS